MKITYQTLTLEADTEAKILSLLTNVLPAMKEAIGYTPKPATSHFANANPNGEDGPNVEAYLEATGGQRFKISQAEKESGLTREAAAKQRLEAMETGEIGQPIPKGEMPEDTGEETL